MTAALATFDAERERWAFLADSYWGGSRYRDPSAPTLGSARLSWKVRTAITVDGQPTGGYQLSEVSARRNTYLVPHDGESDADFDARIALGAYVNLVAPIVKAYAEGCTARVHRDLGPLAPYADDVDRRGAAWGELAEDAARWAALYGLVFAVADAPRAAGLRTRADEAAAGARPYVVLVHPPAVAWVACDDAGRITEFAYTDAPYRPTDRTGRTCEVRVRIWRADCDDAPGGWEVRAGSVDATASLAGQATGLRLVDAGPLPPALRGEVPVTWLAYERDGAAVTPAGISLADDAADIARLIFNQLSWISEIHRKAAFPFLAIPMAATGGQLDAATAAKVGPSQGLGFNSAAGAPQWIQPSSDSTRELRDHALFLFALALRTAGLEVAADQSAQVQSGEALRLRSRDFESRAARFARNLQRWELRTLRVLAALAGYPDADVCVTYPKRFTLPDLSEDLNRALALLSSPVELGAKLKVAAIRQAADAALSLSDEALEEALADVAELLAGDRAVATEDARGKLADLQARFAKLRGTDRAPPAAPADLAAQMAQVTDGAG